MRGRNRLPKSAETLKKKTDGFTNPAPSSSRDLKRKRSVTFVDVDHHRSPQAHTGGPSINDAKTSEFAFFNKLKSSFGESSTKVKQNPNTFESGAQTHKFNYAFGLCSHASETGGKDKDISSFSTPIYNARRASSGSPLNLIQKDKGFNRGKDAVRGGNNNLSCGGSSDDKEDFFSVKRKRLNQWVKDTCFPQPTSNGGDLVSLLLTRLFPGTEERHPSRFTKDRVDRRGTRGSKFLKRSQESYSEVDHSLQMEKNRSLSLRGWLENSIPPSLQFATNHVHSSFIPSDPQDFSFSISYPKEWIYRGPPLLTQKASMSFPVEETLDSSLHFRNHKSLSMGYHGEGIGYSAEGLPYDHREEPSSALLLEWNTENASTRKTDDLPLSDHTKLITYPNASSSSSLADNPWNSDYSSSHDVVTRELYPLPLLSDYTSGSFLLPSHFEHEFERHIIDDEDLVAPNQNLQTFHHATREYTYYPCLSNSPVDHSPSKVPGCEIASFPFYSISNSNLLEASSPTQNDRWWI